MSSYSYYINTNWVIEHNGKKICINPLFLKKIACDPEKTSIDDIAGYQSIPGTIVNFMYNTNINNPNILCSESSYILSFDESMCWFFKDAKGYQRSYIPNYGTHETCDIWEECINLGFTEEEMNHDVSIIFVNENPMQLITSYLCS